MNFLLALARCGLATILILLLFGTTLRADDTPAEKPAEDPFAKQRFNPPVGLNRFVKGRDIWLDGKRKRVVIDGVICLREGQLEMFACLRHTKEHESVIAVNCTAKQAHAGLLYVGAISGHPASFEPEYSPATGTIIDIVILWIDKEGKKHNTKAQNWVRNIKTRKAMKYDWVFAGSGVWVDPENGDVFYHADSGDFICVSNFPSATLDLPVESPQANSRLRYDAYTKNIPAKGTPIRMVLTPRRPQPTKTKPATGDADNAKKDDGKEQPAEKKSEATPPIEKKTVGTS